jgi:hypothetical protein
MPDGSRYATFGGTPYVAPPATEGGAPVVRPAVLTAAATTVNGVCAAVLTAPATAAWLVHRIVVQNSVKGRALVYVGTVGREAVVSGTVSGEFDENDTHAPIFVAESTPLTVVWDNPGDALARIEYREV